jgi:hypothetical protein
MLKGIPPGADLSKIPLAKNPDGSPPNFMDPPSLVAEAYSVILILMITSFTIMALRLYSNILSHRKLLVDDCKLYCSSFPNSSNEAEANRLKIFAS